MFVFVLILDIFGLYYCLLFSGVYSAFAGDETILLSVILFLLCD